MAPLRTFYTLEIPPSRAARCFLATLLSPHRGRPPGGGSRPAAPHRLAPAPADERPAADARCAARFCAGGRAADLESGRGRGGGGRLVAPLSCRCPPRRSRRSRRKAGFDCHLLGARESAAGGGGGEFRGCPRSAAGIARRRPQVCATPGEALFSPPSPSFFEQPQFSASPFAFCAAPAPGAASRGTGCAQCHARRAQRFTPLSPPRGGGGDRPISAVFARIAARGLPCACSGHPHPTRVFLGWGWGGQQTSAKLSGADQRPLPPGGQRGSRGGGLSRRPGRASRSHRYFWTQKRHSSDTR